jgi:catechol 2,3-dioxygenase-like lactoylglutathione lyase family enzyme
MLSKREFHATLPVQDLNRAKHFYAEKLGLQPESETTRGLIYRVKDSWFLLFPSSGSPTGQFTQGGWTTDDIEVDVAELKSRGVIFEEYDYPNLKTVNGIAQIGADKAAWFKDSEGNLLGLIQMEQET